MWMLTLEIEAPRVSLPELRIGQDFLLHLHTIIYPW